MDKIKKLISEHKVFFSIFFVAVALLCVEYVAVNTYVDKKTKPTSNKISNRISNINELPEDKKKIIGISSNSNSNSNTSKSTVTTEKIVEKKTEEKKKELSNSNVNPNFVEYDKKTDEEKQKIDYIPSEEGVSNDKLDIIDDNKKEVLPSKFDLNDVITLNYKDQQSYGLCWDFASTKVFETYLALNYNQQYDFSEIAIDYLASGLVYGEDHFLHSGGDFFAYNGVVKKLGGLIESKNIPFDYMHKYSKEEYLNFLNLPRVSIDEYEVVKFPTYHIYENKLYTLSDIEATEEDLEKYRTLMKKHIMNNSALYFGVSVSSRSIGRDKKEKKELARGEYANIDYSQAYYCSLDDCTWRSGGHAMTIIGWDDNFDRRVFKQQDKDGNIYYPKNNGAFIVANSYSTEKQYYYISYEDSEIYRQVIGIKNTSNIDLSKYLNITNFPSKAKTLFNKGKVVIKDGQEYISYSDLDEVSYLLLNDKGYTSEDLAYLKYFKNLEYLYIDNNNITDLSFLSSLTKLEELNARDNNISDISVLDSLPKLKSINLANNNISDISVLKNLYELETIVLDDNQLINYENIFSDLTSIKIISLENCGINNLYLNENINYSSINLSSNPNLNIMTKIKTNVLDLNNNNYTNLDVLSKVDSEKLQNISLSDNDIKDVSILANYKNLNSINLSGNKNIESFDSVLNLFKKENKNVNKVSTSLFSGAINDFSKKYTEDHIEINEQGVQEEQEEFEDFQFASVKELVLENCNISDITLFNNLDISILNLANNNITNVDNFENDNIIELNLSGNRLENSDVSNLFNEYIVELYLSNTGLSKLKINKELDYLGTLDLSNNDLTDISALKKVKNIGILSLENNINLSDINLSSDIWVVNLTNTGIDDTIVDKIDFEVVRVINLSSNRNIKDMKEVVKNISNKSKEISNKKRDEAMEEHHITEYSDDYELYMYENEYFSNSLILNGQVLDVFLSDNYTTVYTDYELNLSKDDDGSINLLSDENYNLFRFVINRDIVNGKISRDYTKLYVDSNSYIEFYDTIDHSMGYKIRFN